MPFFLFRKRRRRRFVFFGILSILLLVLFILFWVAMMHLRPIMNTMASVTISNVIHRAVADAVAETLSTGSYDYDDLITLEKDNEGKITALTSNMVQFNRLQIEVTENVMKKVGSVTGSELAVPVGSLTGDAILAGRGPEIHVRILAVGSPDAEFENRFTDAGINQTKHQIVLNITVNVQILMPGYTTSTVVNNSLAVAETVIVGSVPDSYTYFDAGNLDNVKEYVIN